MAANDLTRATPPAPRATPDVLASLTLGVAPDNLASLTLGVAPDNLASPALDEPRALGEFDSKLDYQGYAPEDLPAIRATYGNYLVMLDCLGPRPSGFVAVVGVIRYGILGRCTKAVAAERVLGYLSDEDASALADRPTILVCTPPFGGSQAAAIAEMAMQEESYFAAKSTVFFALDAALAFDPDKVSPHVEEAIRRLGERGPRLPTTATVDPPSGEWKIYEEGGAPTPSLDQISHRIRKFATRPVLIPSPPPPMDEAEAAAIVEIHDLLALHQGTEHLASRLAAAALANPTYARLCHAAELFSADRKPRLCVSWDQYGDALLSNLLAEERASVTRQDSRVTAAEPYVLTLEEMLAIGVPHSPRSVEHAIERLDTYVGGYLRDLDLSRTMITGSAIAAALIVTKAEKRKGSFEAYLASHYPPTQTIPRDREEYLALFGDPPPHGRGYHYETTRTETGFELRIEARDFVDTRGTFSLDRLGATLDVRPGADLDMAVDVETDEEFDEVALGHYRVIRARHPDAVLRRVDRDARHNWEIATTCPEAVATFRPVEIYRANFGHVATHHVGMVSGAYTQAFEGFQAPRFVATARFACSMSRLATPNYYYFASRKISPAQVLMKYRMRGFGLDALPKDLQVALDVAVYQDPVWHVSRVQRKFPALYGKGFFSAYSAPGELALYAERRSGRWLPEE